MKKIEIAILREAITAVAHHNEHAWDQLKREVFSHGYQAYYPAQSFFESPASVAIDALPHTKKTALVRSWKSTRPQEANKSNEYILSLFADLIVEKVVERARAAANRTDKW